MSGASFGRLSIVEDGSVADADAPPSGLAKAIYFNSGDHSLFGWLHEVPLAATRNMGLVVCKPFGYEAICAHRSLRAFSETAASLGIPTLRVDYLGTGDSADIDPAADQLAVWTADVCAAIAELRRRTGVQRVCLLGLRLGALLATLAAAECPAVTSLILIAPIVSGRRYLRDLRLTRAAAGLGHTESSPAMPADSPHAAPGSMEVSGFFYSAATLAALALVDLKTHQGPAVGRALVIDDKSLPTSAPWVEQLTKQGIETKYLALPGLIAMTMTAPQYATIPSAMLEATRDWLDEFSVSDPATAKEGARAAATPAAAATSVMHLPNGGELASLTERPVFLNAAAPVFGIVTEPRQGETRRRAVILLNAGADYHVGANGMHVDLAREWASRGYVALRMDLAGLGDSATRSGQPDNEVFPPAGLDDIRAAIDYLRDKYGAGDITLFGLCSGAYHALRAAAAGLAVNRILMVNPQNYFWKQGASLDDLQVAEVVHNPGLYRQRMFTLAAWKKMLSGRVNVLRVAKIYLYRPVLELESRLRNLARRMHLRLPNDLGSELEQIDKRRVRIVFVFARGEPGIDLLKIQAGSSVNRLADRCRMHIVEGGDHIFSQSGPRGVMKKILSDELFARV
jgi:pimeloyl-ACP methyl ester carboxylesterase